jgi:hypothetical protein
MTIDMGRKPKHSGKNTTHPFYQVTEKEYENVFRIMYHQSKEDTWHEITFPTWEMAMKHYDLLRKDELVDSISQVVKDVDPIKDERKTTET